MGYHTVLVFLCLAYFPCIMSSTFTHVVINGRISFFLSLNNIPVCVCLCVHVFFSVCMPHFIIHSSVNRHLSDFHIWAIVNNALQDSNFIAFGYIQSNGIAGLYGSFSFNFLRKLHPAFHSGYTN